MTLPAVAKPSAVSKPKRPCVLRTVVVGERRLIQYQSLLDVLECEPTPDDPRTVTRKKAVELTGLSIATIDRMIARGLQVEPA
ncbi:hypothetical protein [Bradyrhizobium sp. LTSP857]|uniref:hypothetical protein n=1 Tax=Bradyrhizobium sp. LTSP857 TaxID=1619231 RepID=UPI0005D295BC|nr:hypothetical protein [Bradyrhizobium sp. LTSP857]KJC37721.1 hypothetical protein UP06_30425 [Bradyrhizobium sp. LTSP857]